MNFVIENIGTIVVALVLGIIVFIIIRYLLRKKTERKKCAEGCFGCPAFDQCNEEQKKSYLQ